MVLYCLVHIHEILEDGEERNDKLLGFFTSKKKVYQAIKRYKDLPGFNKQQAIFYEDNYGDGEGFSFFKLIPGMSDWREGYVSIAEIAASEGITIVPDEDTAEEDAALLIDVPYYMRDHTLHLTENSVQFLQNLLDEQYQGQDYPRGPQSEFYQLKELSAYVNNKL